MPYASWDLLLDPAGDAAVRRQWRALLDADLPSQARHRSPSNAPHVTAVAAPRVDPSGGGEVARLLPAPVAVAGLVVLGSRPYVLAHLVRPPAELTDAVVRLRTGLGVTDPWLPHLTLARRLTAAQVGAALEAVATVPPLPALVIASLRHWDPAHPEAEPAGRAD